MALMKYCCIPVINSTLTLNGSNFQNIAVGYCKFCGAMDHLMAPGPFNMALFDDDNQDCNLSGQENYEDGVEPVETRDGEKGNCVK